MEKKDELLTFAQKSMKNAYSPYSKFKVGAAILSNDGKIYSGCNVENIAFPSGSCAEQGAISAMINGGGTKIVALLVIADSQSLITPCGNCLQKISEFADKDTPIYLANTSGIQKQLKLQELMPNAFKEF